MPRLASMLSPRLAAVNFLRRRETAASSALALPAFQCIEPVFEYILSDHLARRAQQFFEQSPLPARQIQHRAIHLRRTRDGIEAERTEHINPAPARSRPPQYGAQSRIELRQFEWLDQIVIRTGVQSADSILDAVTRGKNHDGHRHTRISAQCAQELHAVDIGQTEVENDGVVSGPRGRGERFLAVAERFDGKALRSPDRGCMPSENSTKMARRR